MEALSIVLGILALGAGAAAVYVGLGRATLNARVAVAEADAARAKQELEGERRRAVEEIQKFQARLDELNGRFSAAQADAARLAHQITANDQLHKSALESEQAIFRERADSIAQQKRMLEERIEKLNKQFQDQFDAIAGRALKTANDEIMRRTEALLIADRQKAAAEMELKTAAVDQLIKPIGETLEKTGLKLAEIDRQRVESVSMLTEHLRAVAAGNQELRDETGRLVKALREPQVRGRYGEMQLKRVAELAGMVNYCDFFEQDQTVDSDGNALRPDMVVRMPSERVVVVDAKTNIRGYLDALEARTPDEAEACLDRFARHVADQATALAKKKYWSQYEGSPEFVVMFIPGDQFIDAALSREPTLLETAARQRVLLAGPAMLIGLLRAVEMGYREQSLAHAAAELRELGIEFHERAATAFRHVSRLGSALTDAVGKYNDFVGSYQTRLEPTLRKFEENGARSAKELGPVEQVEARPRVVLYRSPELGAGSEPANPGDAAGV